MPYTPAQLFPTQMLPATALALYTAKITTRIDKLAFTNPSSNPVTVTIYLVPSGGAAGVANQVSAKVLNAGEDWDCYRAVNAILLPGDLLATVASTANVVVVSGSGTQVS